MSSTDRVPGHRPWWPVLRGLVTAAGAAVGGVVVSWLCVAGLVTLFAEPCGPDDLACFTGLFAVDIAVIIGLIAVAAFGPLLGRLLRAPCPSWFWPPAAWLLVTAIAWLGPAAASVWLITVVVVSLVGYPVTMVVLSVRMDRRQGDLAARGGPTVR